MAGEKDVPQLEDPPDTAGMDRVPPAVAEQLSALLDDALPAEEVPLLLARCGAPDAGDAARAVLARYALIGEALRGQADPGAVGVADRVRSAIDDPRSRDAAAPRTPGGWLLPAAGVAASVALAVVVAAALAPESRRPAVPGLLLPASVPVATASPPALDNQQITDYLVYHGEYTGLLSTKLVDSHIVSQRAAAWQTVPSAP